MYLKCKHTAMSLKLIRISNLQRLQKMRNAAGPAELGTVIGRKTNQTSDLLLGRASFGEKLARSIEKAAGLEDGWLDQVEDLELPAAKPQKKSLPADSGVLLIPQFETGGAMGNGITLRDQPGVIKGWSVSEEWVAKNAKNYTAPTNLCIVTGFGDSMRPLFNPGDPLLVDSGVKSVEFDSIYFFRVGDEGFIKRLQRIPGVGLRAISENKAYESWDITKGMDFEVFGRVVKAWAGEDF